MSMYNDNCFYHDTQYGKSSECRFYCNNRCLLGFKLSKLKSKKYIHKYSTSDYDFYGAPEGSSSHKDKESENYIPQPLKCKTDGTMKDIEQTMDNIYSKNKREQKEKRIKKLMGGRQYKENIVKASKYCEDCPSAAIAFLGYNSCRNIYRSCRGGSQRVGGYHDPYHYVFKDGKCPEYGKEKYEKFLDEKYTSFEVL